MQSSATTNTPTPWFQPIVGESPQIRGVIDQINRVAPTDASVSSVKGFGKGTGGAVHP
jgi:DNA-binding NtrC family response regulator